MSSLPPPPPSTPSPPSAPAATTPNRCYRHPNREAYRACTRCGKVACADCLIQASVGSHCLDCARASRPAASTRLKYWNARQPVLVTYTIMAINIAVFVLIAVAEPSTTGGRQRVSELQFDLALAEPFLRINHEWYRLVTSGFVHFGLIHIGFNMLLLFQLGHLLERPLGRIRFGLLYAASLLGGSAGVLLIDPNSVTAGASGAVFGLMGAAFIGLRQRGINPFSTGIGTTLVLNLVLTFTVPGISIGGHLGGVVAGAACGVLMFPPRHRPTPEWATYAAPAGVAVLAVIISFVVAS
jgi:membrane associated rhomboid family serine protease